MRFVVVLLVLLAAAAASPALAAGGGIPSNALATGAAADSLGRNCYNNGAATLPHWRAALAKVRAGTGNARVLMFGDSTTIGVDAGSSATWPNEGRHLAAMLNGEGVSASEEGWFGGSAGKRYSADNRISKGAAWGTFSYTLGGEVLEAHSAGAFTYTPATQVDTFKVWYTDYAAGPTFSGQINSGSTSNVTLTGTGSFWKQATFTAALGTNTLKLNWVSGAQVYIGGIEAYNSAAPSVHITNAGWWGGTTAGWVLNSSYYAPLATLSAFAADLVIIKPGINDASGSVGTETFIANVQTLITTIKAAGGDVILVSGNPVYALQADYNVALKALAISIGVPFVDNYGRWGTWAAANALGFEDDSAHPNAAGYADTAASIFDCMMMR